MPAIWLIPLWGALQPGQAFPFNLYPWIAAGLIAAAWIFASFKGGKAAEKVA